MCIMREAVYTFELLIDLGFERAVGGSAKHSVQYQTRHQDLTALQAANRFGMDIVLLSGVVKRERAVTLVHQEIPAWMGSREEAAAWVSYALWECRYLFEPLPDWFSAGVESWDYIPWVRERREDERQLEAWRRCPRCRVDREEARILRRRMRSSLSELDGESDMTVEFDGRVLSIQLCTDVHRVVASGTEWSSRYRADVSPRTELPSRFREPSVTLSIWEGHLLMDGIRLGRCYKETTRQAKHGNTAPMSGADG